MEINTPETVHVWRIDLNSPAPPDTLSGDEITRAACLRFPQDRLRWTASRAAMRGILGQYLQCPPARVAFVSDKMGKPRLAEASHPGGLRFNLSHSHGLALLAVARGQEIGIDIERARQNFEPLELAQSVFAPQEIAHLQDAPEQMRPQLFYTFWTAKEALAKAHGAGLSLPHSQFSIANLAHTDTASVLGFTVRTLPAEPGYAAALATRTENPHIYRHDWQE